MNWALFNQFLESHTRVFFRNNAHTVYGIVSDNTTAVVELPSATHRP